MAANWNEKNLTHPEQNSRVLGHSSRLEASLEWQLPDPLPLAPEKLRQIPDE